MKLQLIARKGEVGDRLPAIVKAVGRAMRGEQCSCGDLHKAIRGDLPEKDKAPLIPALRGMLEQAQGEKERIRALMLKRIMEVIRE